MFREFHFNPEKLVEKLVEHEIVEPETKEFQCSDYLMNSDLLTTTRGDQIEIENIKDFQLLVNFLKTLEIYENWMSQIRFDCVDSQRNPPLCNA